MKITGMMIYYYFVCKRKLWYFYHNICMEQNNEQVSIGKILDENSYIREKKGVLIDNTINIDFVKNKLILHEIKKTKAIEEAGIWQTKYYIYYLKQKGLKNIIAKIDYPLLKESKEIILEEKDIEKLEGIISEIENILRKEKPCEMLKLSICKKCAYFDLCYV